ncbi:hypothetical protein COO60DRAFT_1492906 [Scenedesmus sp. NREL 46B-D3]|nr:hypothetical protein COO60DRAFT_1492906 [Scenedesmus sp. NREL 46B-D3]
MPMQLQRCMPVDSALLLFRVLLLVTQCWRCGSGRHLLCKQYCMQSTCAARTVYVLGMMCGRAAADLVFNDHASVRGASATWLCSIVNTCWWWRWWWRQARWLPLQEGPQLWR